MSENQDLMKKIQLSFQRLSKGQKMIAQYIMDNYDKAAFMTAAKLGEKVGVSESTVVRFANVLDFEGYPQLQSELQEMIRTRLTTVQRIEMSADYSSEENTLKKVLKADIDNLRITMDSIDYKVFEASVKSITEAKHIYIVALRSSTTLADFLGFYLNLIRDNVYITSRSISDTFEMLFRVDKDDLVIGIGFPRYSSKTIEALHYAKSQGAKVLAITDSILSPLAANSDFTLTAKSNMESFVDSLVAPLSLLNALIVAVGIKEKNKVASSFAKLEEIWEQYNVYSNKEKNSK
ncbi:MurR/RpiR family transcriptional regulator [Lutispora saccharofermentans]|uniref:MurR/RpiR family transcriptional regulator n=1 Tax=Lutispora saccharofermentans TaxID=3024236 RepID=A0ABT1NHS4_9FIRM|nr:MurR/RpiR family transcriptional regulator [Lutispora saccharofermentans]MCQ1529866.1 MurR/RpiR family transcriptional regulator [Lutispora saccharofermentans]